MRLCDMLFFRCAVGMKVSLLIIIFLGMFDIFSL